MHELTDELSKSDAFVAVFVAVDCQPVNFFLTQESQTRKGEKGKKNNENLWIALEMERALAHK